MAKREGVTNQEKAALYFQILERCDNWQEVYKIAIGEKEYNNLTVKTKQSNSSRWKTSYRIQKAHEEIKRNLNAAKEEEIKKHLANLETETPGGTTKNGNAAKTNFLDRDEFLRFLNERANKITDDKLRNDILKMLSDNLRYKDGDNNETQEIQRFYTPKTCEACEIYNKCKFCNIAECPKV